MKYTDYRTIYGTLGSASEADPREKAREELKRKVMVEEAKELVGELRDLGVRAKFHHSSDSVSIIYRGTSIAMTAMEFSNNPASVITQALKLKESVDGKTVNGGTPDPYMDKQAYGQRWDREEIAQIKRDDEELRRYEWAAMKDAQDPGERKQKRVSPGKPAAAPEPALPQPHKFPEIDL